MTLFRSIMTAQPMLLRIINTEIPSITSQTIIKQGELDIFTEVVRLYQQNHDGIDLLRVVCD